VGVGLVGGALILDFLLQASWRASATFELFCEVTAHWNPGHVLTGLGVLGDGPLDGLPPQPELTASAASAGAGVRLEDSGPHDHTRNSHASMFRVGSWYSGSLALPLPAQLRNIDGSHETKAVCRMRVVALQGRKDGVYSTRKAEAKRGEVRGSKNCAKRAAISLVAGYL
jgi:hypothetical protein